MTEPPFDMLAHAQAELDRLYALEASLCFSAQERRDIARLVGVSLPELRVVEMPEHWAAVHQATFELINAVLDAAEDVLANHSERPAENPSVHRAEGADQNRTGARFRAADGGLS